MAFWKHQDSHRKTKSIFLRNYSTKNQKRQEKTLKQQVKSAPKEENEFESQQNVKSDSFRSPFFNCRKST